MAGLYIRELMFTAAQVAEKNMAKVLGFWGSFTAAQVAEKQSTLGRPSSRCSLPHR